MGAASPPDSPVAASGGCFACFSRPPPPQRTKAPASPAAADTRTALTFMRALSAPPPPAREGSTNITGYSLPRHARAANRNEERTGPALVVQPFSFRKPDASHKPLRSVAAPPRAVSSQCSASLADADASAHVVTDAATSSKRSSGHMRGGLDDATRSGALSAATRTLRTTAEAAPADATGAPLRVLHTSEVSTLGTLTTRVARTMDQPDARQRLATALTNMALAQPPELFNERYLLMNETVQVPPLPGLPASFVIRNWKEHRL